jgi:cytochrome c oxidase assembly protein subunit 15
VEVKVSSRHLHEAKVPLRYLQRLSGLAAIVCYLLIVFGAVVRVTGSGEGCPGWPLCYGVTPLWRLHSVIEYTHRVLAGAVAVLVVLTAAAVWIGGYRLSLLRITANLAVVLLVVQIALGGITVLTHLSGPLVALHLATALALLGALIALAFLTRPDPQLAGYGHDRPEHVAARENPHERTRLAIGATALLVLTYVTAIMGSLLVDTESDLACAAWPACSPQSFFPQMAPQALSFLHRLGVVLLVAVVMVMLVQIRSLHGRRRTVWIASWGVAVVLAAQALVGALNIWLKAPPLWEGIHVAGAAAVWAATVVLAALIFRLRATAMG